MDLYLRPELYDISYSLVLDSIGCADGFLYEQVGESSLLVEKIVGLQNQRLVLASGILVDPERVSFGEQDQLRNEFDNQENRTVKLNFLIEHGLRVKRGSEILVLRVGEVDFFCNHVEFFLGGRRFEVALEFVDLKMQSKLLLEELKKDFLDAAQRCLAAARDILNDFSCFYNLKADLEFRQFDENFEEVLLIDPRNAVLIEFVRSFMCFISKEVPVITDLIDLCVNLADKKRLFFNLEIYSELVDFVDDTSDRFDLISFKARIRNQGRILTKENVANLLSSYKEARQVLDPEHFDEINLEVSNFVELMLETSRPDKFVHLDDIESVIGGLRGLARFFLTNVGFSILNSDEWRMRLFELNDAFGQRRAIIRRFLKFSTDVDQLKGLDNLQAVDKMNALYDARLDLPVCLKFEIWNLY